MSWRIVQCCVLIALTGAAYGVTSAPARAEPSPAPTAAALPQEESDADETSNLRGATIQAIGTVASYGPGNVTVLQAVPRVDVLQIGRSLLKVALPRYAWVNDGTSGFGDTILSYLFSVPGPRNGRIGIGLSALVPSASKPQFGVGSWTIGPAIGEVRFTQARRAAYGYYVQTGFSFAGPAARRNQSAVTLQPFYVLRLGRGWSLRSADATWAFDLHRGSTLVPVSLGVGRLFRAGDRSLNLILADSVTVIHANGPRLPKNTIKVAVRIIDGVLGL